MPKDTSRSDISSVVPNESASETIGDRRKRLAQLVGRLLAQNWLKRQRAADNAEPPKGDRP